MFLQVSGWSAFTAGFLSFFTPCLLPLVPAYIMYLTGSFDAQDLAKKRTKAIVQTLGFILGFTIVFMILGVSARTPAPRLRRTTAPEWRCRAGRTNPRPPRLPRHSRARAAAWRRRVRSGTATRQQTGFGDETRYPGRYRCKR